MAVIRLGPFLGVNTALNPKLLPDNVGTLSVNHRSDRGDLRPWNVPAIVKTGVSTNTKTIYPMARTAKTDPIYWFTWSTVVHAIKSFSADNTTQRFYYSGAVGIKATDNVIGLAGEPYPTAYRDIGIPKPPVVPIVTQTQAGTGDDEERIYAYTYLNDWDQEGPPALSPVITCKPGAHFSIAIAAPITGPGNQRGINRVRLYRTVAGDAGAEFYFLRDVNLPALVTTDNNITPGTDTMPSRNYALPPDDLTHLTAMWNGIAAGISGDSVRYCEVNRLHAWPIEYETLCPDKPVALAVYQQTLVVATTGRPRIITGSLPESMDDDPVELIAPCVSARSMMAFGHGACWASADGIAYVGSGGPPRIITGGIMTPEQWAALNPSTMIAGQYRGLYFLFYETFPGSNFMAGICIDPLAPQNGFHHIVGNFRAAHYDAISGSLYLLGQGGAISEWNAGAETMAATFQSKVFRMLTPLNMAVAEIVADEYPVTFTMTADERAPWVRVVDDREPFSLPAGYTAHNWQFRVDTDKDVTAVVVAETLGELEQS